MRRWRRWLALAVLLLLAAAALAPLSGPGSRLVLGLLDRAPGVTIEGVEGRLFGSLRIRRLVLALPALDLSVTALETELRPACLLRGTLCLAILQGGSVSVTVPAGQGGGSMPALPYPFRVGELAVGDLRVVVAGVAVAVEELEARDLSGARRRIEAAALQGRFPEVGQVAGRASLRLAAGLPLTAEGDFRPASPLRMRLPAGVGLTGPVSFTLAGPIAALAVEAGATADVDAAGGRSRADGRGTLRWPALELEALHLALPTGALDVTGTFDLAAPSGQGAMDLRAVAVPATAARGLGPISGRARFTFATAGGTRVDVTALRLDSHLDDRALNVAGRGAWRPGPVLPTLDLTGSLGAIGWRVGGGGGRPITVRGEATEGIARSGVAAARLVFEGTLAADASTLDVEAQLAGLAGTGWGADNASGNAQLDLAARRIDAGTVVLEAVTARGYRVPRVRVSGAGSAGAFELAASLDGDVAGEVEVAAGRAGDEWRLTLSPLSLATPLGRLTLPERVSATLSPVAGTLTFPSHCWKLQTLALCLDAGAAGERGTVVGSVEGTVALPSERLAVLAAASGEVSGQFRVRYGEGPVSGSARAGIGAIVLRPRDGDGPLPSPGALDLTIELEESLEVRGSLAGGALGAVDLRARREGGSWAGSLAIAGAPVGYVQPLVPALARLEGTLAGELSLATAAPGYLTGGALTLSDGAVALRSSEAVFEALTLRLTPQENGAVAVAGEGRLGGGPLALRGELDPWAPALQLAITGDRNAVHWPGLIEATVSPDLRVALADGAPSLTGQLRVHAGQLSPAQVGAGGVDVSPDATVVGDGATERRQELARIDLRILVEERFRVTGDFVEATVGGDLRLRHDPGTPAQLFGRVRVVGGELSAYGQTLALREGSMGFVGDPENPDLSLRAERSFPSGPLRVGITVDGTLQEPRLSIYSEPQLPRDAELSWLLRGRPPDAGASLDGTALAVSLGASALNQTELVRALNRLPGLSNISLGTESGSSGTAATISGYVGERLYLSYGVGLYEPVNTLTARLYLQARLWLEMVSELENSIDLYYRFDIE